MDALSYEYLIRKAYNCERGGAEGRANATAYQKMEKVEKAIKTSMSISSSGELEYNYRAASIQVSMNIYDAIMKVLKDYHFTNENKKFKKHLEKLADDIYMATDRKLIDNTIANTHDIFSRMKLALK